MKLLNPTDDELNIAFAKNVCGWYQDISLEKEMFWASRGWATTRKLPAFTTSADAVLPWLDRHYSWHIEKAIKGYRCVIADEQWWLGSDALVRVDTDTWQYEGRADNAARACAIALLRANGVEIVFDSPR